MKRLWQSLNRVFNILFPLLFLYVWFIHPYLNSATPWRDMFQAVLTTLLPIILSILVNLSLIKKVARYYRGKHLTLPQKWNEHIPVPTMRAIYVVLITLMVGGIGSLWIFVSLFSWLAAILLN